MTAPEQSSYAEICQAIEGRLDTLKRAVTTEIRNYPQPIAGCDAQIPALWEKRDGLVSELNRLAALINDPSPRKLQQFVAFSVWLETEEKRKFAETIGVIISTNPKRARSAAE